MPLDSAKDLMRLGRLHLGYVWMSVWGIALKGLFGFNSIANITINFKSADKSNGLILFR